MKWAPLRMRVDERVPAGVVLHLKGSYLESHSQELEERREQVTRLSLTQNDPSQPRRADAARMNSAEV